MGVGGRGRVGLTVTCTRAMVGTGTIGAVTEEPRATAAVTLPKEIVCVRAVTAAGIRTRAVKLPWLLTQINRRRETGASHRACT